jgi:hypothetical protein
VALTRTGRLSGSLRNDSRADRPGRITGYGSLVFYQRDHFAWDPAGVVRVYSGQMWKGAANGAGQLITAEGLEYTGNWASGRANGLGHLKLPNGEEYIGSFRDGFAEGNGRNFEVTGEVFEGKFHAGLRQGSGKTKLPSGFAYESEWHEGIESPRSRRVRLAQVGGAGGIGGADDVRIGITVQQTPRLPRGVESSDIVPYGSSNDGEKITVKPADHQLIAAWKEAGELQTYPGFSDIRNGIFDIQEKYIDALPPTLLIDFQNHSSQTIQITRLRLDVAKSDTDNTPAIQLLDFGNSVCNEKGFTADYELQNFGWSPATSTQLHLFFTADSGQVTKSLGAHHKPPPP